MMQNNLFLRQLVIVTKDGKIAYDESFHRGVNIIHGQNSSGKSTIIRFIFFALGGCYCDFVPEALQCRYVMAEVEINGRIYTLKRVLEKTATDGHVNKKCAMDIYFGSIAECKADKRPEKWKHFGYDSTSHSRSFSNVLFEIMGLPEVKEGTNITMHQMLRLIYHDQESPLPSLFFFEQFDQPITRETVAELLMGLYDSHLSEAKLEKIKLGKKMEELKLSIKSIRHFIDNPQKMSPAFITNQIEGLNKEILEKSEKVRQLREGETQQKLKKKEHEQLQQQVARLREEDRQLTEEKERLMAEIQDSEYFIHTLQKKIAAVDRSISTRGYFDTLHLVYCPECLTRIDDDVEDGYCRLCKSPVDHSKGNSQAMRIKLELQFQMQESQKIVDSNREHLNAINDQSVALRRELKRAQEHYDYALRNVRSTRDEMIDELLLAKGRQEGEIMQYLTLLEDAEKYERLVTEQLEVKERLGQLEQFINAAENKIQKQRKIIETAISRNGIYLLKHDQDRQAEFSRATDFKMDFSQNIVYLSDRHIKLSASSSFYLKMAARFAIFLSSVQEDSMKYPRLILSDNMEDKGLEEERSRNFQKILVERLKTQPNANYQVIFATSNIAQELNTPAYTVGEYYTRENKSLKNISLT